MNCEPKSQVGPKLTSKGEYFNFYGDNFLVLPDKILLGVRRDPKDSRKCLIVREDLKRREAESQKAIAESECMIYVMLASRDNSKFYTGDFEGCVSVFKVPRDFEPIKKVKALGLGNHGPIYSGLRMGGFQIFGGMNSVRVVDSATDELRVSDHLPLEEIRSISVLTEDVWSKFQGNGSVQLLLSGEQEPEDQFKWSVFELRNQTSGIGQRGESGDPKKLPMEADAAKLKQSRKESQCSQSLEIKTLKKESKTQKNKYKKKIMDLKSDLNEKTNQISQMEMKLNSLKEKPALNQYSALNEILEKIKSSQPGDSVRLNMYTLEGKG